MRHVLLAQAMLPEYAERFRGLDDDELDALADSFRLASCVPRVTPGGMCCARGSWKNRAVSAELLLERAG